MNDTYLLNRPSCGRSISAEEYAASLAAGTCRGGRSTGSGCGQTCNCGCNCECGCNCTCPPVCDCDQSCGCDCGGEGGGLEEGCCCKQSFRTAFRLLLGSEAAAVIDLDQAAFLTDYYLAGAQLLPFNPASPAQDNLTATLTGSLLRLSPDSCDMLEIAAVPFYPTVGVASPLPFTAAQVSLCGLNAVAIQTAQAAPDGDLPSEETTARNFRWLKRTMAGRLAGGRSGCIQCACGDCQEDGECCCAEGILSALAGGSLSRRVSLTAGPLALADVELLGAVGSVLVLAGDATQRIYFVCVNKVQFLG